jgi:hypothetical protein
MADPEDSYAAPEIIAVERRSIRDDPRRSSSLRNRFRVRRSGTHRPRAPAECRAEFQRIIRQVFSRVVEGPQLQSDPDADVRTRRSTRASIRRLVRGFQSSVLCES